jgi:hypothetical protein
MSKALFLSILLILIILPVFAEGRELSYFINENLSFEVGERTWISYARSDRNHADGDGTPDPISELKYEDIDSVITEFNVSTLFRKKYVFRVDVGFGGIDNGTLVDRDYLGDGRTQLFSTADATIGEENDSVFYVNTEAGYQVWDIESGDGRLTSRANSGNADTDFNEANTTRQGAIIGINFRW